MTKERITEEADETIKSLVSDGYDHGQIIDAMCDGEFLSKAGIVQEVAEEICSILV